MKKTIITITTLLALAVAAMPASAAGKKSSGGKRGASKGGGSSLSFRSCKQARAAGYSHMRKGQPGYSRKLDRDGDGIACDKHG